MLDQITDPLDAVLDRPGKVRRARHALRPREHQEVGEAARHHADRCARAICPLVSEHRPVDPPDVDPVERSGDRVEAGGVHDDVEVVVAGGRLDAVCGDPHDRRVLQRHEFDIVTVVRLEIVGLERQALERETVVGRDQLLGDLGIVDPTSDAVGDVVREFLIGSLVEVDLGIVRADDRKARPCVELIPERSTFLGRGLPEPPSRNMLEATDGGRTVLEDLRVTAADLRHFLIGDRSVVERAAPVGSTLENREVFDDRRDRRDDLDAGGAGADLADPLAGEIEIVGPAEGVERLACELVHALEGRKRRRRQRAEGRDHEPGAEGLAVRGGERPRACCFIPGHRGDADPEAHVFTETEEVGDMVEIAEILRLRGEQFLPVPRIEDLLTERVAVGVALRIEPATRVAVAEPGSAEVVLGFEHERVSAEIDEALDLVDPGDACADDDYLVFVYATHCADSAGAPEWAPTVRGSG